MDRDIGTENSGRACVRFVGQGGASASSFRSARGSGRRSRRGGIAAKGEYQAIVKMRSAGIRPLFASQEQADASPTNLTQAHSGIRN